MIKLENIKYVIFDCDGVIFDSNQLKSLAFRKALEAHEVAEDQITSFLKYHQTYGGISRYVKLKYLITDILKVPFDKKLYESLLSSYAEKSLQCYFEANYTDGCLNFLDTLKSKNILLFVASGSDETELNIAFKNREVDTYFQKIYGSPKPKLEIIKNYILPDIEPAYTIFIGDAPPDMEVAHLCGIRGYGVKKYAENSDGLINYAKKYNFLYTDTLNDFII